MKVFVYLSLAILGLAACKSNTGEQAAQEPLTNNVDSLEYQVMAIHDEAMPRLNEINHLLAQIRRMREGIQETPEGKIELPEGMNAITEQLKLAEQGMWDWMKAYSDAKDESLQGDALVDFYKKELVKVQKVRDDIATGIDSAKSWIQENSPQQ